MARTMTAPKVEDVTTHRELVNLAATLGVRPDWHEPDEQEVTVRVAGRKFDNAMCDETERHVLVLKDGKPVARVNLALLFAWACDFRGGE